MSQQARSQIGSPPIDDNEPHPTLGITVRNRFNQVSPKVRHLASILAIGVAGGLGGAALMALPVALTGIPIEIIWFFRNPLWWVLTCSLLLMVDPAQVAAALKPWHRDTIARWARRMGPTRSARVAGALVSGARRALAPPLTGRISRLDAVCAWVLGGPATVIAASVAALFLLMWIPHYLTWPWWPDVDQFAVSAQSWSAGIVPYRDLLDFDFPGPIYVHFLLGKIFGWGPTVAFYCFDAGLLTILWVALMTWSRRLFGSALPGLVSFLTFLGTYLNLDFSLVAQRDWHAPLFVVLGLFALELWPGTNGQVISAIALGLALTFRPQEVVFLPAVAAAIDEGSRPAGAQWQRSNRPWLAWSAMFAVSLLLAYSPLILTGIFDDFVRCLRAPLGGPYNGFSAYAFAHGLIMHFRDSGTMLVLTAVTVLAVAGPDALRRPARTWGLALLGSFIYKPMSPIPHNYLDQPIALVWAINLALLVAWLLAAYGWAAWARLATLIVILMNCVPGVPKYCSAARSLRALGPLVRGEDPVEKPLGCWTQFGRLIGPREWYRWEDYRPLLAYLRESTPPDARIANLLWNVPYPCVNGPAGRLTPFPAAGGYIHLWIVDRSLSQDYVTILEQNTDILVVWGPGKENPFFPELDRTIRQWYVPLTRIGAIEVWRHRRAGSANGAEVEDSAGSG